MRQAALHLTYFWTLIICLGWEWLGSDQQTDPPSTLPVITNSIQPTKPGSTALKIWPCGLNTPDFRRRQAARRITLDSSSFEDTTRTASRTMLTRYGITTTGKSTDILSDPPEAKRKRKLKKMRQIRNVGLTSAYAPGADFTFSGTITISNLPNPGKLTLHTIIAVIFLSNGATTYQLDSDRYYLSLSPVGGSGSGIVAEGGLTNDLETLINSGTLNYTVTIPDVSIWIGGIFTPNLIAGFLTVEFSEN